MEGALVPVSSALPGAWRLGRPGSPTVKGAGHPHVVVGHVSAVELRWTLGSFGPSGVKSRS